MNNKPHPPTRRRLGDARRRGFEPNSVLFSNGMAVVVAALLLIGGSVLFVERFVAIWRSLWTPDFTVLPSLVQPFEPLLLPLLCLFGGLWLSTLLASFVMRGQFFNWSLLAPDWSRFGQHGTRPWNLRSWSELAVRFLAAAVLLTLSLLLLWRIFVKQDWSAGLAGGTALKQQLGWWGMALLSVTLLLALGHLFVARRRYFRELGMSRQELLDELRQTEGSPLWKAERRRFERQPERNRELDAIEIAVGEPATLLIGLARAEADGAQTQIVTRLHGRDVLPVWRYLQGRGVPTVIDLELAGRLAELESGASVPNEWLDRKAAKNSQPLLARECE